MFRNGIQEHVMTTRNLRPISNWGHIFHLQTKKSSKLASEDLEKRFEQSITFNGLKARKVFARSLPQLLEIR